MKKLSCFISLAACFAVSLFFSCSSSVDPPPPDGPQNSFYCIYDDSQVCLSVASPITCPNGGVFDISCPFGEPTPGPSSGSGSQGYCVFIDLQECLGATSTTCPSGSVLLPSCPFGNPSSNSTGKSSSSNQQANNSSSGGGGCVAVPGPSGVGPVSYYGKLKASGNKIIGSKTCSPVQVRGVSLFWSNTGWGGDKFFTAAAVNAMVDDWEAEIIRVPVGYSEYGGYKDDPSGNLARAKTAIDAAIAKNVYVIIDWHSHNAHNETSAAAAFFTEMAGLYGNKDNVIFEIFNEPLDISWQSIKTYANSIISTIRATGSDNLILVGTPNWDQDVNWAASSQVTDSKSNIAYVFHFYAAEHTRAMFESNITTTLNAGYPVFVSEYGTVEASGDGYHDASSANAWHTYMDNKKISSCAWSVNNKDESASFFIPTFSPSASSAAWANTSNMTSSGQYIFNKLRTYASSAEWRTGSVTTSSSGGSNGSSSGSEVSATRCKDDQGRTYFCEWSSGCYAIDPAFSESSGGCSDLVRECWSYGYLFVNSTTEEERYCDGNAVSVTDAVCLDYGDYSCIPMGTITSCSAWAYEPMIGNMCPNGWDRY